MNTEKEASNTSRELRMKAKYIAIYWSSDHVLQVKIQNKQWQCMQHVTLHHGKTIQSLF